MPEIDTTRSANKRRWWRLTFSLRTFLIAIAMLSVSLGLFSRESVRLRRQRAVVAQLGAAGVGVGYDYSPLADSAVPRRDFMARLFRQIFGKDVFADVYSLNWDYTYRPVNGSDVELVLRLPAVSEVAFYGPTTVSGRPPLANGPLGSAGAAREDPEPHTLEAQAASFGLLADSASLRQLTLYGGLATDAHLKKLGRGGALRSLRILSSPNVSDEGVIAIAGFNSLEWLRICAAPKVTDRGVAHLERLSELKSLDLSETSITDEALSHIGKLGRLESLAFHQCAITDDGIRELSKLTRLKKVRISSTKVTDASMSALGTLNQLQELDLSGTHLTDAGLDQLVRLPKLAVLMIMGTNVTDEGLLQLKNAQDLRHLGVTLSERVSREGVRRLKEYLPSCLIECGRHDPTTGATVLEAWE
jgi:hypothetical protein